MPKIFSFIIKQKKTAIFVVLFLIAMGIVLPATADASFLSETLKLAIDLGKLANGIPGAGADLGRDVIAAAGKIMISIIISFLWLAQSLLNLVLTSASVQKAVISDATVIRGWTTVRDFANMFIVLGFVVIGLATILRLRDYEAQKLLPTLIGVALLINFSMLICGVFIDGSNITLNYFLQGTTSVSGSSITTPIVNALSDKSVFAAMEASLKVNDWLQFGSIVASVSLMAGISGMLFIIYAVLFLFRQVALMCLVILSPLAFVCYVFPRTKNIFDTWLKQFTQWCLVGIPAAFFMWLAADMLNGLTKGASNGGSPSQISFWLPVAFLYFAYTLTFQISAIGAAGAIGAASGAMGFVGGRMAGGAAGASKWAAGRAASATGLTRAGQAIGDTATSIGQRLGLVDKSTLGRRQAARLDNAKKDTGFWTDEQRLASATGRSITAKQKQEKLANIEWAAENGKFKTDADVAKAAAFYKSSSIQGKEKLKDLSKKDFRFAEHDEGRVKKYMSDFGVTESVAKQKVKEEQLKTNWSNMNHKDKAGIDTTHLTDSFVTNEMTAGDIRGFSELSTTNPDAILKRSHMKSKAGAHATTLDLTKPVDAALQDAIDRGDISEERRLRTLRKKLQTL